MRSDVSCELEWTIWLSKICFLRNPNKSRRMKVVIGTQNFRRIKPNAKRFKKGDGSRGTKDSFCGIRGASSGFVVILVPRSLGRGHYRGGFGRGTACNWRILAGRGQVVSSL